MPTQARPLGANPISARVADALREAIVRGELRHGEVMTQSGIAAMYSVSTMPVREALLALAIEGMVDARPNHSFRVVRMAREDVEDIYWAQGVLSGQLVRKAIERGFVAATLEELEENGTAMETAIQIGDVDEAAYLSLQFHRTLNLWADSPKLVALLQMTDKQIPHDYNIKLMRETDWAMLSLDQHRNLLRAIRRGSVRAAEAIAINHVATAGEFMIEYLASQGHWDHAAEADPDEGDV